MSTQYAAWAILGFFYFGAVGPMVLSELKLEYSEAIALWIVLHVVFALLLSGIVGVFWAAITVLQ